MRESQIKELVEALFPDEYFESQKRFRMLEEYEQFRNPLGVWKIGWDSQTSLVGKDEG